ncbi:T7SS effector LXG polymorphic toxin [Carnobacterium gallinarum]|uniref:T7SS effector LXG polymorphic toxin n=1 Tax=Carnobacterium gallinarum TaxID=2749 RepID=UPI000554EA23|nr:T7SS effector LXG polymorphic toxin [Carnobacterium gallinarum]
MSIDFFIGEVGIQNQSIKSYCNEVISGMEQVRTALSQFVIEPSLKGGAYDSSKSYFNSAYIPATKGFTLVCEAMIKANDRFSKDYKSNVDSNSLQEDVLVSYIYRLNSLSTALEELPAGNIFLSSVIENLQNVRQKTDEKLDKLREFNYTSVHIFDELENQLQNLEAGVMMLVEGKAWNQSTGTFSTMGLNLDWATDINQSWDARDKKKKGFDDEKNKQLEKYDIIRCYDPITKKTTWALEKDGKAVIDPALTKYLNKVGDSLNKSDYSMIEVTPKEWEKRVNDAWKMNGTEYFSGKQYGWSMAGLAHVQDAKGKLDDSGAWDALWSLGFMYGAVKSINKMNQSIEAVNDTKQIITNRYPDEIQNGKSFDFVLENGNIKIRDGIKEVDFIIDTNGNLKVGRGHSYLANTGDVQAAGKMKVNQVGNVRKITNESGHYTPTLEHAKNYEQIFNESGIGTKNSWLEIYQLELTNSGYVNLSTLKRIESVNLK